MARVAGVIAASMAARSSVQRIASPAPVRRIGASTGRAPPAIIAPAKFGQAGVATIAS